MSDSNNSNPSSSSTSEHGAVIIRRTVPRATPMPEWKSEGELQAEREAERERRDAVACDAGATFTSSIPTAEEYETRHRKWLQQWELWRAGALPHRDFLMEARALGIDLFGEYAEKEDEYGGR